MSILDLSVCKERDIEIILPSGKHLNVLRPNVGLVGYVNNYKNLISTISNHDELSDLIIEMSTLIINNNRQNYKLTPKEANIMDEIDRLQIINAYMAYIDRIATNPN